MSGNWTVTWRAIAIDGASPDKWCAMLVSRRVATSAAQAIYIAQGAWQRDKKRRLPGRAFVDWQATDEPVQRRW